MKSGLKRTFASIRAALMLFIFSTSPLNAGEVRISAGAGMKDALTDIAKNYHASHQNTTITPNYGPSGGLAGQILNGAPADIFISANTTWMEFLIEKKLLDPASRKPFARNAIVFTGTTPIQVPSMEDLAKLQRIAIGSPKSVPAGDYAMQAITNAGMKKKLQGKLILARDVRECLMYAELGEVDGGFVYRTDAILAKQATIRFKVPQNLHTPITFPMALTLKGALNPEARDFLNYLESPAAHKVLNAYGFVTKEAGD
ncbi:molybdate ABC transporter substrate-binding protein [Chlorobium phaeovibrioides]|uniref:molybdate ABC transporter substrate-binding protein n=1 Tax=Chlorobium phaeovibrioides TaxID=1094 RepID=UPI001230C1B9|nr:molybdate ABC transporter substrate-binding protein [Chlorobium phaeovibrioides]QEQ56509.1 molybdate ABC transporter substrate-binding protein [Chlorobium phaeovibrioides]